LYFQNLSKKKKKKLTQTQKVLEKAMGTTVFINFHSFRIHESTYIDVFDNLINTLVVVFFYFQRYLSSDNNLLKYLSD